MKLSRNGSVRGGGEEATSRVAVTNKNRTIADLELVNMENQIR